MSNTINANVLKNFIIKTIGGDKLTSKDAQAYDVKQDKFADADIDENGYLDLDEILDNKDLYAQFATLYVEDKEQKADAKDAEKEKEEQTRVQDKNEAGV